MPLSGEHKIGFKEYLKISKKDLIEATSVLLITIFTSVLAGIVLSSFRNILLATPGLIILIPGIISMRGTIQGTMGSRLGSNFHLGLIKKPTMADPIVRQNVYTALFLSAYLSVVIAIFAGVFSYIFRIRSLNIFSLISISFAGSMLSTLILFLLTFLILFRAYSKGWDISTIHAPVVASFGDFVTIPIMLFAAIALNYFANYHFVFTIIVFAILAMITFFVLKMPDEFKKIVKESIPIHAVSAALSASSGIILQGNLKQLAKIPSILALVPSFAGQAGNIGSVFASRVSADMHLGLIKPKFELKGHAEHEISHTYIFGILGYPLIGGLTYLVARFTGLPLPANPMLLILVSLIAGAILSSVIVIAAFISSIEAYKHSIDPDNILIPIVVGLGDMLSVISLFIVLHLMHIV